MQITFEKYLLIIVGANDYRAAFAIAMTIFRKASKYNYLVSIITDTSDPGAAVKEDGLKSKRTQIQIRLFVRSINSSMSIEATSVEFFMDPTATYK